MVFLLDVSDTIHAYEERGKQRVAPLNQYEKGMRVLSGMDRHQQVEVLHGKTPHARFNSMAFRMSIS